MNLRDIVMLNTPQIVSLARALIILFGGMAVGAGWITKEDLELLSDTATLTAVVGGAVALIGIGSAVYARRTAGLVAATSKLDGVGAIIAKPEIAEAVPRANVVASATEAQRVVGSGPV